MLKYLTGDVRIMSDLFFRIKAKLYEIASEIYGKKTFDANQADVMVADMGYMMQNSIRIRNYADIWEGLGDAARLATMRRYLERHKKICDSLRSKEKKLGLDVFNTDVIERQIAQANRIIESGTFYGMNRKVASA